MQRITTLIVSLLFSYILPAQEVNGFWKGQLVMEPGGCFPVYNVEFQLKISGNKITGNSYHYSDTTNYVKEVFEGLYDSVNKSALLEERSVSVFRIPANCTPCLKKYLLTFHTNGKEEQLRGTWTGEKMDGKGACPAGSIVLNRLSESTFKPDVSAALILKKNELVKEIYVDTGTIKLDFYDNGQIDGDTISVFVDNVPVVSRKQLATKPQTVFLKIDMTHKEREVIMVGENLGSIPPNTALMIVNANDKRYQLFLASDEKKNAMVRFIYQKPQ